MINKKEIPRFFGLPVYENPLLPKDAVLIAPAGSIELGEVVIVGSLARFKVRCDIERIAVIKANGGAIG